MKYKILGLALLAVVFTSCKNEPRGNKQDAGQEPAAAVVSNDFFRVTLDVVAKKDDSFHVFYTDDGTMNFSEDRSIWNEFKGSEESQKLVFDLPKGKKPTHLRIDYGLNKDQGEVKINSLEISYKEKSKVIPGSDYFKYFRPNLDNTVVNVGEQTVKALNAPGKEFAGPSTYPLENLPAELKKLTE
ncbi:hypothetical protein [Flavobacterium sp.]